MSDMLLAPGTFARSPSANDPQAQPGNRSVGGYFHPSPSLDAKDLFLLPSSVSPQQPRSFDPGRFVGTVTRSFLASQIRYADCAFALVVRSRSRGIYPSVCPGGPVWGLDSKTPVAFGERRTLKSQTYIIRVRMSIPCPSDSAGVGPGQRPPFPCSWRLHESGGRGLGSGRGRKGS